MNWFSKKKTTPVVEETIVEGKDKYTIIKATLKGSVINVNFDVLPSGDYENVSGYWYELPFMNEVDKDLSSCLDMCARYCTKWKGDYPTAHISKFKK